VEEGQDGRFSIVDGVQTVYISPWLDLWPTTKVSWTSLLFPLPLTLLPSSFYILHDALLCAREVPESRSLALLHGSPSSHPHCPPEKTGFTLLISGLILHLKPHMGLQSIALLAHIHSEHPRSAASSDNVPLSQAHRTLSIVLHCW
jgi:hypothetical protein